MVVIWNPTIRKSVGIVIPILKAGYERTIVGFGVCPDTNEPKLVKINVAKIPSMWEVEVFSLSIRLCKTVYIGAPFKSCNLVCYEVLVDGVIYFGAWDHSKYFVISFDLKSEKFGEVCLPETLVHTHALTMTKVNESLGLLEYYNEDEMWICGVWKRKDSANKPFTKIYTVKVEGKSWFDRILSFINKDDGAILQGVEINLKLVKLLFDLIRNKTLKEMAVIWNPTIRKSVGIVIPILKAGYEHTIVGFGVCPDTNDPKLVKINVTKIPIDGVIYFGASDHSKYFVISFDLKSEKFGEVCLPETLVHIHALTMTKVNESLGLLEYYNEDEMWICGVWKRKDSTNKPFTKIYTVKVEGKSGFDMVLGFRNNGEVVISLVDDDGYKESRIEVYEPLFGHTNGVGISRKAYTFSVRCRDQAEGNAGERGLVAGITVPLYGSHGLR
ncbi:putative pentatricopeptide repeat-containing protein [Tanacetum coccineum]